MEDYYEILKQYALNDNNYKGWRKEHTKIFGEIFSSAFAENTEAQIHLTAALINISKRNFAGAMPKLDILEAICTNDFDEAVVSYFKGLNHELLANEKEMNEYYENLRRSDVSLVFPLPFHPYYRTAKFAQRDSECSKAIFYYKKALEFYDGTVPNAKNKSTVSQIIYDIATLHLYTHDYEDCKSFLELSEKYDPTENQQRNFVTAILHAVQGRKSECYALVEGMNRFFRENLEPAVEAIFAGLDLHYCVVPQDRSAYGDFWSYMDSRKNELEELVFDEKTEDAQKIISGQLSEVLSFMKRNIDCRIDISDGCITVYCKNYRVKTLVSEYHALFSEKSDSLDKWHFISVNEFENY